MSGPTPPDGFSSVFDQTIEIEPDGGRAYFGLNVLDGLTTGIREFTQLRQPRWRQYRSLGPTLLGCAMWIDDPQLLDALAGLPAACVVVSKQARTKTSIRKLQRLQDFNERTNGLPLHHFRDLEDLMPRVDGRPVVVGPCTPRHEGSVPTIRTTGFRKSAGPSGLAPILHAKLALLGQMWWHDEDGFGPADYTSFIPKRLWISSANFTASSRRSLEVGFWTEDQALLRGAERFLTRLVAHSEELDPNANHPEPDLAPVEFDDVAMAEAMAAVADDDPCGSPEWDDIGGVPTR